MTILEEIIETKRLEVNRARKTLSRELLREQALACTRLVVPFREALSASPSGIIAEFKRKSPSKGFIHPDARVEDVVPAYARAGAAALSVLTDRTYFGGSAADLIRARSLADIPILRKDFIIDASQIDEARLLGADAVLLIAAVLTPEESLQLARYAFSLGLQVLLEIHRASELCCLNKYVDVVGINNRNLDVFRTDVQCSFDLADAVPAGKLKISESGISSPETVKSLRAAGFQGFLMGENFMKEADPGEALARFVAAL